MRIVMGYLDMDTLLYYASQLGVEDTEILEKAGQKIGAFLPPVKDAYANRFICALAQPPVLAAFS